MIEPRVLVPATRLLAIVFGVFTAVLIAAAGMMMFSAFMFYDDEGYVLISLRNFAAHGHLYGDVFSQYGPFPYALYYVLHLLGLPFTHTAGRLLTLVAWSGAAIASASLVWHDTRGYSARLAVLASVFVYLWIMVSEPTHPGGLIAFVTAVLACWGYRWIATGRTLAWARLAGAGAALLLLTKINIGGFAALSAIGWLLLHHKNDTIRRCAPRFLLIGVVLLPMALMRPLLDATWVQTYALMFACTGFGAVGAIALAQSPRAGWRELRSGTIWAAGSALLVLGIVFARGTSPADVLEGVVLRPLRHPVHFNLAFPWVAGVPANAIAAVGFFIVAWICRGRAAARVDDFVAWARIAGAVALAVLITRFPASSPDNLLLSFAVPWLWLFLWPLSGEEGSRIAARSWLGLLFLGQCLHAFPVRGSQTAWGTFLALPVAAIGAWHAAGWLAARYPASAFRRWGSVALNVAVIAFAVTTGWRLVQVGNRYYEGRDLDLPGAERIRLPENATALFRLLAINASAHGDMLFSLPGMFSLNLWSGLPTPTLANVTHWFSLLEAGQQQAIIHALEAHPRACVIVQREHVHFITKRGFAPHGALNDYLNEHFAPAFAIDDFEFCVRKGRKIAPLLLGEIYTRKIISDGAAENTLLQVSLQLPAGTTVETVEIFETSTPGVSPLVLGSANSRVEITPITLEGETTAVTQAKPWPILLTGPALVLFYFDGKGKRFVPEKTLVVLHDVSGTEVALIRVRP